MSTRWPSQALYQEALEALARLAWQGSPASRQRAQPPVWFMDLVVVRGMGMLTLVMGAPEPWVVFPDVVPGFSGVALRKPPGVLGMPRPERLQVRYFHGEEALDMDHLVQNALAQLVQRWSRENPGMLRFSDDHLLLFVFPSTSLDPVLLRLGLPAQVLAERSWVKDGDVDWAAAGLA